MTSTWQIIELKRTPSTGVVTGVVFAIDFQEGSEQTYIARDRYINEITLTGSPNEPGFIPFENLTEQTVINWVQSELGSTVINAITSEYQAVLQNEVNSKVNPEYLTGKPW